MWSYYQFLSIQYSTNTWSLKKYRSIIYLLTMPNTYRTFISTFLTNFKPRQWSSCHNVAGTSVFSHGIIEEATLFCLIIPSIELTFGVSVLSIPDLVTDKLTSFFILKIPIYFKWPWGSTHWEELLQSVSDFIFSKHCGYRSRSLKGVKRSEIL